MRTHNFLCDGSADGCAALHVLLEAAEGVVSVMNVHLPWDSCKERQRQAVAVNAFIARQQARQYFLLGDFNADMNDSVDRFLGEIRRSMVRRLAMLVRSCQRGGHHLLTMQKRRQRFGQQCLLFSFTR